MLDASRAGDTIPLPWHAPSTPTLVALDLETTGLDPARDSIIEIGAVKFKGDRVENEWSVLANPGRPLSPFITSLTGITDAMLAGAPPLGASLGTLTEFVGECDMVGHNIKFDLGFLQKKGALSYIEGLDTFDLASVLLPDAGRYSLASLAATLGVLLTDAHRALDDARATFQVYRALVKRAEQLPLDLLAEIAQLGQEVVGWGAGQAFEEAMAGAQEKRRLRPAASATRRPASSMSLASRRRQPPAFARGDRVRWTCRRWRICWKRWAVRRGFRTSSTGPSRWRCCGAWPRRSPRRSTCWPRPGTGTGKSLAYLIPAIQWSMQNGQRVVVSTNTINLQDQLIEKDIPDLHRVLDTPFKAAVLKGRSNYLCPRRFDALRRHGPRNADEMRLLAKVLVWLATTTGRKRGDRAGPDTDWPAEQMAWSRLSAEDEGCTADRCAELMDGICPFYRARRAAMQRTY